jgi:hypothetical protein
MINALIQSHIKKPLLFHNGLFGANGHMQC